MEPDTFGRLRQLDGGKSLQPFVVGDALLGARQVSAGAEMCPAAKRDVLGKLGAVVIERRRTREFVFVAIGAGSAQKDLATFFDDHAPELDLLGGDAMGGL